MANGDDGHPLDPKAPPRSYNSWGAGVFYGGLGRLGCVLRLCIISVQSFARVVADYTGQDGGKKGDDILHEPSSFPLERVAAMEIILKSDGKGGVE